MNKIPKKKKEKKRANPESNLPEENATSTKHQATGGEQIKNNKPSWKTSITSQQEKQAQLQRSTKFKTQAQELQQKYEKDNLTSQIQRAQCKCWQRFS